MEEESHALLLWKSKLNDIVEIAHQIRNEDTKAAEELWLGAFKDIQIIWEHNISQDKEEDGCTHQEQESNEQVEECEMVEIQKLVKTEQLEMKYDKEEILEETVQVKAEVLNEGDNNGQKVQSVHLMISADPGMNSGVNSLKKDEPHGKKEDSFKCDICPKELRSSAALRRHMKTHKRRKNSNEDSEDEQDSTYKDKMKFPPDDRPFKCCHCPGAFKTRGRLVRHKATHTGEKPWPCSVCGKNYTEKRSLTVHMRTHTGERPYECATCHKKFTQSGVLQTHLLTHTDKYAYLCYICGRSFRQRSHLVTHCRRHQGIKPYSCSECESKFTAKGDFDRHLRTHTGERPHHCDICGSSFARAETLREHKNRHFNFKPYICKLCGKSFYELTACSRHVKNIHVKENDKISTSDSIIRSTSNAPYQESYEDKERIQLVESISEASIIVPESVEISLEKQEEKKFITVHQDNIEIVGNSDDPLFYDKQSDENCKFMCRDCGSAFSSVKGLNAHGRYCKHRKKSGFQGDNPRMSTKVTAKLPSVPVTQWLAEHAASYNSVIPDEEDQVDVPENSKVKTEETCESIKYIQMDVSEDSEVKIEETCESIEYIQEIEDNSVGHAVSIDEDGSITSLPLSQLAPIHIQLENDYMVVLSDSSRIQDGSTTAFSDKEMHQVEIEEDSHNIVEGDASEHRITLVLNPSSN